MNHVLKVFQYELRRNLARKGFLFTAFGIPVIAFVLFFGINSFAANANRNATEEIIQDIQFDRGGIKEVGYIDESGLFTQPGELATDITAYPDEDAAKAAMEVGEIDAYYVIPADYIETGNVLVVLPDFTLTNLEAAPVPIQELIFSQFSEGVDPALLARLQTPSSIQKIEFERDAQAGQTRNEGQDFLLVYAFAGLFTMALFGTNGYLMQSIIEEKETRLIEILITSVRPIQLLAGKILALGLLGILQISAWLGTVFVLSRIAAEISDTQSPTAFLQNINLSVGTLVLLFIYFILGYLFFAAAFGAIGALSQSMTEGPSFSIIFTLPLMLPFLFLTAFIDAPNSTAPVVLSIFPLTAPIAMAMRLAVVDVPLWQLGLSMGLMALADAAMIWFAGRLFRFQSLLAGQVPKLKDIPALLRG